MFIYLISEESILDADSIRNNNKLETLIKLRTKYKIPILILLTHSDDYCDKIKKADNNWKIICKEHIINNKQNLLNYINGQIKEVKENNFKLDENKIIHTVLIESKKMSDEEAIKLLPKKLKSKYENANEEKKKEILEDYKSIIESDEVRDFFEEENMNILYQKELIEIIKENIPSQYHSALSHID